MSGLGALSQSCSPACNTIRYGDYSGISLDGSNPNSVWVAGEYGNANTSNAPSPVWGTMIAEYGS